MKKLFTLILLIGGVACTASAGKLFIKTSNQGWWGDGGAITAISFDGGSYADMSTVYMYGERWAVTELPTSYSSVKIMRHVGGEYFNETSVLISGNEDCYQNMTDGNLSDISAPKWNYLVFRQNIINWEGNNGTTWDDNDMHNTSHPDGDTFIFELTKAQIDASSNKGEGIRFRLRNSDHVNFNDAGNYINGYPQIYPTASASQITIGNNTTTYYHNTDGTTWYWQVDIPSYDFTKIVLTAKYVNESGYKWKISADAYLPAITTNAFGYCTYVTPVALTIADGATGYYATDNNNGSATAQIINNPVEGTPMLIKGTASTSYSFKVATSGTTASDNAFQAGTGAALASTTDGKYNYILNGEVFKAANNQIVGTNKAYLQLSAAAGARGALIFDNEEETGINVVTASAKNNDAYYNLNGQRITSPSKGLYIVNGRKVIMK